MTTSEFLSDLREREIRLWIEGVDSLRYEAPPGSLTPYLLSELRSRKLEILEFLRRAHDADVVERPIDPVDRDEPLPLSFAQQRLWFLDRLGTGPGYNIPMTMRLRGELDIEALRESLDTVVERHEVLRTTFEETDDGPVQRIAPTLHIPMPVEDLNGFDEDERMEAARRRARDEAMESFDLATGPVLRARLLELDAEDHVLLLTMHHIATDGWSMGVLTRELMESYRAFIRGDEPELAELPIQYADFAHWQRAWLQGEVFERQLAYWKDRLGGAPRLDLPTDHPRPAVQTYAGSGHRFSIGLEVYESIKRLSRAHGVTPAITLMAAFRVLLSRYTGQEDIVLGSPIANRNRKEIENLIGFFVNTLALRVDLAGNPTFVELLRRERDSSLAAYDHQDFPFERLVEELDPERDLSQNPIFQVTFSVQNTPGEPLKLPGLLVKPFDLGTVTTTRFDLELQVGEIRNGLYASFSYNTDLFNASTIERMADHYAMLLEAIVADPDARLLELPLLDDEERCQVVDVWNRTSRSFPSDKCVHELFEAQVERTPDHLAVAFNGASLTYRELDARANQLAHALIARRVGAESRVGICVERSLEMVIGLLGILKAGGAYVPIDPSHPAQRRALVVNDAGASLVLTRQEDADTFADVDAGVISLDAAWSVIARSSADAPLPCSGPGNLAYVIYTSGSTGRPKGVCVTHAGLSNYLAWSTDAYGLEAGCVSLVHSSISFDLTVTSLLGPLVVGGTAHLVPDAPGVEALAAAVRGVPRVDLLKITPAHVELLSQELSADERAGIGTLVIGGEALTARHVALWEGSGVRSTLVNEYGPTETVVGVSIYRVPPGAPRSGSVPIGRPVANTQIYVVDKKFQPVPIGIPGELLIGGIQVARDTTVVPT